MKILLLEDDEFICNQIKNYFELFDNRVDFYNNGEDLLNSDNLKNYDIFLFDINTPKLNGFKTLKLLREKKISTPVIYITAQNDISHIKQAYELGCNDYIKKPFILEEVELRIKQIVYKNKDLLTKISPNYSFDLSSLDLFYKNDLVDLKIHEKNLLYLLVKNIGTVINSSIIREYVWENKEVCENTLRTQIKKIRHKIDENFIINIRNVGYKIEKYG